MGLPIRGIGILAHVDAGKTTLTENFLQEQRRSTDTLQQLLAVPNWKLAISNSQSSIAWPLTLDSPHNSFPTPPAARTFSPMSQRLPIRNIGILAHVDAGKTTLTENFLYLSGGIKTPGNVDKGTSLSDAMDVEKRRGISVRASTLSFSWNDVQINLIDTPGHVDFAAEVERSLRVLDGAVLVVSAVEGIQSQTEAIWRGLESLQIPTLILINKIDRIGADALAVADDLRKAFTPDILLLNRPVDEAQPHAAVGDLTPEQRAQMLETVAAGDDQLMEAYLEGDEISPEAIRQAIANGIRNRHLFPTLCGVAKNNIGVRELLDGIVSWLPNADRSADRAVSGVVYRIDHDAKLGRIAGVRMYAGRLQTRDIVQNHTAGREEKITQIKKLSLNRLEDAGVLEAGDIGLLCGMPEVRIGDILGDPGPVPGNVALCEPLLSVQVIPSTDADIILLADALRMLSSEDPHLNFEWVSEERELHVSIMGVIQTEILTEVLRTRFGLSATFGKPTVIYKETPSTSGIIGEAYTMPKPCWAIVKYRIEPGPRGSGVSYRSEVGVNDIRKRWQSEIEEGLPGALKQGIKGWEITDLRITLVEGSDHVQHSRPGNWIIATNIAILKGLTTTGSTLLEPILAYRITAPQEYSGKITSDMITMRGTFDPPESMGGSFTLTGRVPLSTSMDYTIRLSSLTGGRAKLSQFFDGYEVCPDGQGVTRDYRGISPLDRSKYILKMRGAITTSVKDD